MMFPLLFWLTFVGPKSAPADVVRPTIAITADGMLHVSGQAGTTYVVERSEDLVNWGFWAEATAPGSCRAVVGFYRARD